MPSLDLSSKRVVVTGATGFLGGHVLNVLRAALATVVAVVQQKRSASRQNSLDDAAIETFWFEHPDEMVASVRAARPDYVIHLHAAITTERSAAAVQSTLEGNLLPSLELMVACAEMKVQRLILLGSGEEFGPVSGPFDDQTAVDPSSPYGASKAAITGYAKMFHRAFGLPVVVLRPSVIYGPFQAPRMLIPQIMTSLAERKEVSVTEGRQTRDFIYVEDVAAGILAALVAENIDGHAFNLASGEVVTVRDCLGRIEKITGQSGLIQYGAIPYKVGEIFFYEPVAETSFAALGWRPAVTLDEGLARTWASITHP